MAKELNENTGFNVSIKTLAGIGFAMATIIGMWFMLQADIAEAKLLPEPTNIASAPSWIIKDASAGVAIPPALKFGTGNFPIFLTCSIRKYGALIFFE